MFTKSVIAELFIREYDTGGSHPSLVECSDGYQYVVKHSQLGNSYHHLINEYIAAHLANLSQNEIKNIFNGVLKNAGY